MSQLFLAKNLFGKIFSRIRVSTSQQTDGQIDKAIDERRYRGGERKSRRAAATNRILQMNFPY